MPNNPVPPGYGQMEGYGDEMPAPEILNDPKLSQVFLKAYFAQKGDANVPTQSPAELSKKILNAAKAMQVQQFNQTPQPKAPGPMRPNRQSILGSPMA